MLINAYNSYNNNVHVKPNERKKQDGLSFSGSNSNEQVDSFQREKNDKNKFCGPIPTTLISRAAEECGGFSGASVAIAALSGSVFGGILTAIAFICKNTPKK